MAERALPTDEQLEADLQSSPFHRLFELKIVEVDRANERLAIRQRFTASVERATNSRQFHGGAIASLIDITGDYALVAALGFGVPTINFRVDFLRPAIATDLTATAVVRRVGKTVGVVDVDVVDDASKLVAVGRGCYGTRLS